MDVKSGLDCDLYVGDYVRLVSGRIEMSEVSEWIIIDGIGDRIRIEASDADSDFCGTVITVSRDQILKIKKAA